MRNFGRRQHARGRQRGQFVGLGPIDRGERRGEREPQRLVEVVRAQRIVASNATYLVKSLVQTGFLERYPDPDDRRTAIVAPTPKAQAATALLQAALSPAPTALPQVKAAAGAARLLETVCSADEAPAAEPAPPEPGDPIPGHPAGIADPRYLMPGPDTPDERWGEEEGLRGELEELDEDRNL